MELEIIKHNYILFRDLLRAVAIKTVAWPHGLGSQVEWIVGNMRDEDEHVFLKDGNKDMAYMTLSPVTGLLDGVQTSFRGVGCVCSANPGMVGGKLLLISINQYFDSENYKGLLFCKKSLINFYSKYNWKLIPPERVHFSTPHEGVFTMVYNCEDVERLEYDDRFF